MATINTNVPHISKEQRQAHYLELVAKAKRIKALNTNSTDSQSVDCITFMFVMTEKDQKVMIILLEGLSETSKMKINSTLGFCSDRFIPELYRVLLSKKEYQRLCGIRVIELEKVAKNISSLYGKNLQLAISQTLAQPEIDRNTVIKDLKFTELQIESIADYISVWYSSFPDKLKEKMSI